MKMNQIQEGNLLKVEIEGRLDTATSPQLEAASSSITSKLHY